LSNTILKYNSDLTDLVL